MSRFPRRILAALTVSTIAVAPLTNAVAQAQTAEEALKNADAALKVGQQAATMFEGLSSGSSERKSATPSHGNSSNNGGGGTVSEPGTTSPVSEELLINVPNQTSWLTKNVQVKIGNKAYPNSFRSRSGAGSITLNDRTTTGYTSISGVLGFDANTTTSAAYVRVEIYENGKLLPVPANFERIELGQSIPFTHKFKQGNKVQIVFRGYKGDDSTVHPVGFSLGTPKVK